MANKFVPINASELQMYKVLQRANLLCYFDVFVAQGGDDVSQLLEADEDEFLEVMSLVGMSSKPLHVRRLQRALQDWLLKPGLFQQPVVNTNPSVTDSLPKELVLAVMNNAVPMPAAIANCPITMDQISKSSAVYKFSQAAAGDVATTNATKDESPPSPIPPSPVESVGATIAPSVSQPLGSDHSRIAKPERVVSPSVRPASATGVPDSVSRAAKAELHQESVEALSSVSAPTSPARTFAQRKMSLSVTVSRNKLGLQTVDDACGNNDLLTTVSSAEKGNVPSKHFDKVSLAVVSPSNIEEDAPSSTDSSATVPARCEKSVSSPSAASDSAACSPASVLSHGHSRHEKYAANGHSNPHASHSPTSDGVDVMGQIVKEICELIKNFESSNEKQNTPSEGKGDAVDLTVKIKKEYLEPELEIKDAPLRLSTVKDKIVEENGVCTLSTDEILQQSRIFPTTRTLTDQEVLINRASLELCKQMPTLLRNKQLLLPLARQVYHIMKKPTTGTESKNKKRKYSSLDTVLSEITSLDVHESAPVRSAKRTYQYVLDNLVKEGYALALNHVIASFQQPENKRIKAS